VTPRAASAFDKNFASTATSPGSALIREAVDSALKLSFSSNL